MLERVKLSAFCLSNVKDPNNMEQYILQMQNEGGAIKELYFTPVPNGIAETVIMEFRDKSKLKISKFIGANGKARLKASAE